MNWPRARTVRTASAKEKVWAATWAEYSPREWPAAKAMERLRDVEFGFEYAEGGDGDGEDGGLGVLGELEGVFGAVEDDVGEAKAEGFVGFLEDGAGGGVGVVEGAAHADGLRALAGKEECDGGGGFGVDHLVVSLE